MRTAHAQAYMCTHTRLGASWVEVVHTPPVEERRVAYCTCAHVHMCTHTRLGASWVEVVRTPPEEERRVAYWALFNTSFALVPRGHSLWSYRMLEALAAGSVPVPRRVLKVDPCPPCPRCPERCPSRAAL